ncbi:MAG: single-stranded DNA-binding protein [Candidatus Thorarchaeota archaeon]|jgi:replication factor A1
MSNDSEPIQATMAELQPRMKNLTISFKVMELGEEREVTSRKDGVSHRILDAVVGDSTGTATMPLWDDNIDNIEVGKTYLLKNGYTGIFKGYLRLNAGRYGVLSEAEEAIEDVKMDNDLSAVEH